MSKAEKQHINGVLWHLIGEYDIIFHIDDLSIPIEDNGVRETNAEYRDAIDKKIKSIVGMYRKNTVTIKGTVEERIEQVKNAVAQYV